jgi:hypothetical protein
MEKILFAIANGKGGSVSENRGRNPQARIIPKLNPPVFRNPELF